MAVCIYSILGASSGEGKGWLNGAMMWWKMAGLPCSAGRWSADGKARACDVVPCVDGGGDAGKSGWRCGGDEGGARECACDVISYRAVSDMWGLAGAPEDSVGVRWWTENGFRRTVPGGCGRCGGSGLTCRPVSEGVLWLAGCRFWRLRCTSGGRLRGRRGCRCRFRGTVPAGTGRRAVRLVRLAG